jgi:hypothetical protein
MRVLAAIGRFWYDVIIGDDWKLAALVAVLVAVGASLVVIGFAGEGLVVLLWLGLVVAFSLAMLVDVRRGRSRP